MARGYAATKSCQTDAVPTEPILTWSVHLMREKPAKVLLLVPFVVLSLVICYSTFHSLLFLAVVLFLFSSSLADFFFPVRYEISDIGASSRTLFSRTFIAWDRVARYYLDDAGIKLSPLANQGRLEAYRGVYLRFGGRKDEVIAVVRRMKDAGNADTSA